MMPANAKRIDADLIGKYGLFNDFPQHSGLRQELAVGPERNVPESVDTQLNELRHVALTPERGAGGRRGLSLSRQYVCPMPKYQRVLG